MMKLFSKILTPVQKGSITIIEKDFKITTKIFWKLKKNNHIQKLKLNEHITRTRKLLIDAVDLRLGLFVNQFHLTYSGYVRHKEVDI